MDLTQVEKDFIAKVADEVVNQEYEYHDRSFGQLVAKVVEDMHEGGWVLDGYQDLDDDEQERRSEELDSVVKPLADAAAEVFGKGYKDRLRQLCVDGLTHALKTRKDDEPTS